MREIKFRAWDKKDGCCEMSYNAEHGDGCFDFEDLLNDPGRWELMQFTGLKDKNGKEIYESDLVLSPRGEKGKVVFVNAGFYAEYLPPDDWDIMCPGECVTTEHEVIGNIYENPDGTEMKGQDNDQDR